MVLASRRGLIASVVITVAVAAVTDGSLAMFGLNAPLQNWPAFAPRGPAIGAIWIVLFAGMGAAYWLSARDRAVLGLIALCLAYPFYTHFLSGHLTELIGNLVTLAYATWLTIRLRATPVAALLVACVAAWIVFATALVIALVQLNGWQT
jgi:tryptophan-rich sensory protein